MLIVPHKEALETKKGVISIRIINHLKDIAGNGSGELASKWTS